MDCAPTLTEWAAGQKPDKKEVAFPVEIAGTVNAATPQNVFCYLHRKGASRGHVPRSD